MRQAGFLLLVKALTINILNDKNFSKLHTMNIERLRILFGKKNVRYNPRHLTMQNGQIYFENKEITITAFAGRLILPGAHITSPPWFLISYKDSGEVIEIQLNDGQDFQAIKEFCKKL